MWVVELKHSDFKHWYPVLEFPRIPGAYYKRAKAEEAVAKMSNDVEYYTPGVGGQYRAVEYIRAEGWVAGCSEPLERGPDLQSRYDTYYPPVFAVFDDVSEVDEKTWARLIEVLGTEVVDTIRPNKNDR